MDNYQNETEEDEDSILEHIANCMQYNLEEPDPALDPEPDAELEDEPEDFDDIYDIFRIHTSNVNIFRNNDLGIYQNSIATYYEHECPICGLGNMTIDVLGSHLIYSHARLFVSLTGSLYPNMTVQQMQNVITDMQRTALIENDELGDTDDNMRQLIYRMLFNDENDDTPSYDELLSLCEYIGYHKQGIVNAENVSTEICAADEDDTCIICLENLISKDKIRKINRCGHMFCSQCIEKWFEENKTCPLCKMDLDSADI